MLPDFILVFFHFEAKMESSLDPSRGAPYFDGVYLVVGSETFTRWIEHLPRLGQLPCAFCHVLLLRNERIGTGVQKISLVEEVPHYLSNGNCREQ